MNTETSQQEKDRRASRQTVQNVDEAGKQEATAESIDSNGQESGSVEVQAVEKKEPITSAADKEMGALRGCMN